MKQCALHTAAASLVRESGVLHGVRANAGFDVPLEDSCLDGVSGNLQVGAGVAPSRCALVAETDRLQVMLESGGAGAVSSGDRPAVVAAGVSRHPHGASAGAPAWQVRSACVNVSSGFADIDVSPGACLQRAGCASAGVASCGVVA